jgi:4-hydroxy-3-methylbut-2-en-1-yl diphosphate reductase
MYVEIDSKSGFCHGVVNAISKAEEALGSADHLYCLGDIVHNTVEVERLHQQGLKTINSEELGNVFNSVVLLRAHGEPPSTYKKAKENGITIIDATCPVVIRLQQRVKRAYEEMKVVGGHVIIYGKQGHAEVVGLIGQTENEAIVISYKEDFNKIDFSKPAILFSQTTQNISNYQKIARELEQKFAESGQYFRSHDTICRQVANRDTHLREYVKLFDVVIFVSDKKSSNGAYLYSVCKQVHDCTYFISSPDEIEKAWFKNDDNVGICGATSTPRWLMEKVAKQLNGLFA